MSLLQEGRRLSRRAGVALVLALFACACSSSSNETGASDASTDATTSDAEAEADASLDDPPIPQKYQAFADAFDAERQSMGAPGAAVAILENGQLTFFHGFGTRSATDPAPIRARSLFRIGSMTKALTATAFLNLVEQGKASLDATLVSLVPDVAIDSPYLASVTMRELLTHDTGLYDYIVVATSGDDSLLSSYLTSKAFADNEYFVEPPGTFWNYANPNFYLVGLALERAGGAYYRDAVEQRVLAPLGMTRTFFLPSEAIADGDYADGVSTGADGGVESVAPDAYDNAWARPAGYAFSSVLDYAKLVQFLYAGNTAVLSDADRAAMQSAQIDTRDFGDLEGYGFATMRRRGVPSGERLVRDEARLARRRHPGLRERFLPRAVDRLRARDVRERRRRALPVVARPRAAVVRGAADAVDDAARGRRRQSEHVRAHRRDVLRFEPSGRGDNRRDAERAHDLRAGARAVGHSVRRDARANRAG